MWIKCRTEAGKQKDAPCGGPDERVGTISVSPDENKSDIILSLIPSGMGK